MTISEFAQRMVETDEDIKRLRVERKKRLDDVNILVSNYWEEFTVPPIPT